MTAIRGRRGERIVTEPAMQKLVDRMHSNIDAIADEVASDLLAETRAAILEELDFPIACSIRIVNVLKVGESLSLVGEKPAKCAEPAVAQIRCRACGRTNLLCESHRAAALGHPSVMCMGCRAAGPALVVYEFNPLAVR